MSSPQTDEPQTTETTSTWGDRVRNNKWAVLLLVAVVVAAIYWFWYRKGAGSSPLNSDQEPFRGISVTRIR